MTRWKIRLLKKPTLQSADNATVTAFGVGACPATQFKLDDNGKKIAFEVKKGDRILCSKYGGTEIKLDGKEYKILSSDDILAILG